MNDRIIEFDPLIEGVLIKRYKRFLADIKLESGEVVTAHCANTGPMKGLLSEGAKVRISVSPSPKRKLPFTWEQICVLDAKNEEVWVGINTLFANKLIKKVIEKNLLNQIIKPEDIANGVFGLLTSLNKSTGNIINIDGEIFKIPLKLYWEKDLIRKHKILKANLKKINIDPALASSVFVTTITDVIGFLSFLGIGSYFFLN